MIVIGGIVSSTESGLACPDWPLCYGKFIPDLSYHIFIEFFHRLWALLVTSSIICLVYFSWKEKSVPHRCLLISVISLILLSFQVFLGMLTVITTLHPLIVSLHLAFATALFALLIYNLLYFKYNPK